MAYYRDTVTQKSWQLLTELTLEFRFVLIGGLVVLALGIAIGLFSAKFLNQSQLQSQLPPTPTLTPSPSTAPLPEVDPQL